MIQILREAHPRLYHPVDDPDGRHHAVVDNGHFGVAALYLLGKHPDAEAWVSAVIDRFRSGVMPYGCGRDGARMRVWYRTRMDSRLVLRMSGTGSM